MIRLTGSKKEIAVRKWLNKNMDGRIPVGTKVTNVFRKFEKDHPELSYGLLNSTIKKAVDEGAVSTGKRPAAKQVTTEQAPPARVEVTIHNIEDMEFPNFKLHKTGKFIDTLFSDHVEGGGLYGGTVNIIIGESGSGKSTVLLDALASFKDINPSIKLLYISSEMTRNDILFYYKKTPQIAKVPTLLMMDYVENGTIDKVLEQTFNDDYDIIVLDSYQDVVVKMKEVLSWKANYAEGWLTNMMITAAEKRGTAVAAIQHLTKGGTYVGSTYLKHATTAMMEIRIDDSGLRYIEFSKNRRGGSMTGKQMYFRLGDNGEVIYDKARFTETEDLRDIQSVETIRQVDLSQKFDDMFFNHKQKDSVVHEDDDLVNGDQIPLEIVAPFIEII